MNTLPADEKYYLLNRDNLAQPIQMQLSQKQKTFSQFPFAFSKSILNYKNFPKRMTSDLMYFPKYLLRKTWFDKCLKSRVSEDR